MNILLTSVGRRRYMIEYFKNAVGEDGHVVAACSDKLTTAMSAAEVSYVTPSIYDQGYIDSIIGICKKEDIKLIVPLFDIDLPVLAAHREELTKTGAVLAVSDLDVVNICNDKLAMCMFLKESGFAVPITSADVKDEAATVLKRMAEESASIIIKPRWGMGSMNIYEAESSLEAEVLYDKAKKEIGKSYLRYEAMADEDHSVLMQEKITGCEYGLDIISDFGGRLQEVVMRKKLAMRAGETDIATIVSDDRLYKIGQRLHAKLSTKGTLRGNLDVDVYDDGKELYVIDLNARFGGGYPFSHAAGVDEVGAYVNWAEGKTIDKNMLTPNIGGTYAKDISMMEIKQG